MGCPIILRSIPLINFCRPCASNSGITLILCLWPISVSLQIMKTSDQVLSYLFYNIVITSQARKQLDKLYYNISSFMGNIFHLNGIYDLLLNNFCVFFLGERLLFCFLEIFLTLSRFLYILKLNNTFSVSLKSSYAI